MRKLLLRALDKTAQLQTNSEALYEEVAARITEEGLGVFLGVEERRPRAVCIVILPTSHAMMAPQVLLVYSEGAPALFRQVAARAREWVQEHGYRRVLGLNMGHDDKVFCRGFRHVGEARVLGSVVEVTF